MSASVSTHGLETVIWGVPELKDRAVYFRFYHDRCVVKHLCDPVSTSRAAMCLCVIY